MEDQTGEVIDKIDVQANAININEVDAVLKQFEGIIEQVPPMPLSYFPLELW
jgi:tRNA pseudouridine55 synthase